MKELGALASWGEECADCVLHLEFLTEAEEKDPELKLKKPIDGNDNDNDNDVIDHGNGYVQPLAATIEFYRAVKELRCQQVGAESPPPPTPDAFLKDYFTLADICGEIISYAQAKSNIMLADRLILPYQAASCSPNSSA